MATTRIAQSRGARQPFWATALTAALLALGFQRRRRGAAQKKDSAEKKAERGWREVARVLYGNVSEHRVTAIAAGVTYFTLLAIFPFVAAIVAIYGLFGDAATLGSQLDQLSYFLPAGAIDVIGSQLTLVASGGKTTLSFALVISILISLWSANAGMKALFDALNIVYGAKEKRGFIKLNAISMTFTAGAVVFLLAAIGILVVLPTAMKYIGFEAATGWILATLRWPLLLLGIILGLAFIYRFGPNRENAQWHWVTVGSAVTSLLWIAFSMMFSYYAANFGSYNKTYGSLGAMVGFMTWMWLSTMVILAGAEIDAVLERADRGTAK
jgi:membrane protein